MPLSKSARINGNRLWSTIDQSAEIGKGRPGGLARLALTDSDKEVRDLFVKWCKEAGLTVTVDRLGSIFGRRKGREDNLPPVMFGSHLDTQLNGGRFDGVLGVLAGLELIRTLNDLNYVTRRPLEVVNWTNEEGSRFSPAMVAALGIIASIINVAFGMWWLGRAEAAARKAGEGYGGGPETAPVIDEKIREQAAPAGDFDPAELPHGKRSLSEPPFVLAVLPLVVVIVTNFLMSLVVFPRLDFSFLAKEQRGGTTIGAVVGVWSVVLALAAANLTVIAVNFRRMPSLRESLDSGANSAALPMMMIASLVGFGAVIAALPAFTLVRDAVFSIQGGPLISLTLAMNVLAGLTGTASGGMAIVLNAFGDNFMRLGAEHGIAPSLMHRVTTISAGTLDALPHNGTVLLLLKISSLTHRESYFDMVMTVIVSVIIALVVVLVLGSVFGSF